MRRSFAADSKPGNQQTRSLPDKSTFLTNGQRLEEYISLYLPLPLETLISDCWSHCTVKGIILYWFVLDVDAMLLPICHLQNLYWIASTLLHCYYHCFNLSTSILTL